MNETNLLPKKIIKANYKAKFEVFTESEKQQLINVLDAIEKGNIELAKGCLQISIDRVK